MPTGDLNTIRQCDGLAQDIYSAISDWERDLGEQNTAFDYETISRYILGCEPGETNVLGVVYPTSLSEVQSALKTASIYNVPIFTISTGKNWGYGSSSPSRDGCVILDLGRMSRIVEVNTELAYAVVEPGVTQAQLSQYLETNNIPLMLDVTGAPPGASLIGNLAERGYGYTPYGDHFLHSCNYEIVLADGSVISTGFGHYSNSNCANLHKSGIGPSLDGLFTQSNFGVITRATIWLMPKPDIFGAYIFEGKSDHEVIEALTLLRKLKLDGSIRGVPHILNDLRTISLFTTSPCPGAIEPDHLEALKRKFHVSSWTCVGGIWGSNSSVTEQGNNLKRAFAKLGELNFVLNKSVEGIYCAPQEDTSDADSLSQIRRTLVLSLTGGTPTTRPLVGTYWKTKEIPTSEFNPPRDRCGVLWFAPVVPLTSRDLKSALEMVRALCNKYSLDINLAFALVTDRTATLTIALLFDRSNESQTLAARKLYRCLVEEFSKLGMYPYRGLTCISNVDDILFSDQDVFWKTCRSIKDVLDPKQILSPGRYGL